MQLQKGQRLGEYEILEAIGAGGMGEVYRARDTRLDRDVAIKVLPASVAGHPQTLARFEREAKAVAALSHPNILAIHGFGTEEGTAFVVTELLEGETLRERLSQGALAPHKAVDLGRQTARGLAAAHEKGIVHRDLKPENLFLTQDGRIKILDFGLATEGNAQSQEGLTETPTRTSLTSPGTVLGTVGYMSPEQVRGQAVDHCSDIFSFGAILHEMLTGKRAFFKETHAETMTAILREEPAEPTSSASHVSPALTAIVRRCLEKQPGERFQSASDLAFSLQAQSDVTATSGATAAVTGVASAATPRRLSLPWAAAVLLAGAALGMAVAAALIRPQPVSSPSFTPLTLRKGTVFSGRFDYDGQGLFYSAAWDGDPLQVFTLSAGSRASRSVSVSGADLLSLSGDGRLALSLERRYTMGWEAIGTLAVSSQASAPRPVLEDVLAADWGPDGESLAVVHEVDGVVRLEYPAGNVLHESDSWISSPRVHPDGDRIAFIEHRARGDNNGHVRVVHLDGRLETSEQRGSWGMDWSPDGTEIWSAGGLSILRGYPGVESQVIYRSPIGLALLDVHPDGRVLIAATTSRREMAVRAPGTDRDESLSWFNWTVARDLTADGTTVLFEEGNLFGDDGYAIFIRKTDGSTPVQLGHGIPIAISPDASWILAIHGYFIDSPRLVLVPTGPGAPRELETGNLQFRQWGAWLPGPTSGDEAAVLFTAQEPQGPVQLFRLSLAEGARPEAVTPASRPLLEWGAAVAPDGTSAVAIPAGRTPMVFPLDGSEPSPVEGLEAGDIPLRFHEDGKHLFVHAVSGNPAVIMRVNLETGERTLWRELSPPDTAGVFNVDRISISGDGEAHVFAYRRITSNLMLADGLE